MHQANIRRLPANQTDRSQRDALWYFRVNGAKSNVAEPTAPSTHRTALYTSMNIASNENKISYRRRRHAACVRSKARCVMPEPVSCIAGLDRCFRFSPRYVEYHTPLGHFRCGNAKIRAILGDPILGLLYGFVDARLVLADRHGKSTAIGANEGIAHEPADRANETLHLGRALLQEIDKLGGSFARILSDYCFHVGVFHLLFVCV